MFLFQPTFLGVDGRGLEHDHVRRHHCLRRTQTAGPCRQSVLHHTLHLRQLHPPQRLSRHCRGQPGGGRGRGGGEGGGRTTATFLPPRGRGHC